MSSDPVSGCPCGGHASYEVKCDARELEAPTRVIVPDRLEICTSFPLQFKLALLPRMLITIKYGAPFPTVWELFAQRTSKRTNANRGLSRSRYRSLAFLLICFQQVSLLCASDSNRLIRS